MIRLISAVAVLMLVGCTAVPSVPTHVQTQGAAIQRSGGAFSASYAGSDGFNTCPTMNGSSFFNFSGSGSGSFIHSSTETGSMTVSGNCIWNGTAVLKNSAHARNTITMNLAFSSDNGVFGDPCHPKGQKHVQFSVLSGTGKFAHATGSGTVAFACHNGKYTDKWSGTITF